MKYYITADSHFKLDQDVSGKFSTLQDSIDCLNYIIDKGSEDSKPKILLHLGDLFDINRPSPLVYSNVISIFKRALSIFDYVIVLLGNHDNNESNYDALAPLEEALSNRFFVVRDVTDLSSLTEETKIDPIIAIPHLSRKLIHKHVPVSRSYDESVLEYINSIKQDLVEQMKDNVVVGHLLIAGAKQGSENSLLRENAYHLSNLKDVRAVIAGHIHKPQEIGTKCGYVGSPTKVDFAERDEEKRFIVYDSSALGSVQAIQSYDIPCLDWKQFDLDFTKLIDLEAVKSLKVKDARVKLVINVTDQNYYKVNLEEIGNIISDNGGFLARHTFNRIDHFVKLDPEKKDNSIDKDVFITNINNMIKEFVYVHDADKNLLKVAFDKCISSIDVDKYKRVQNGEPFRLKSIRLCNFFSYKDAIINFEDGLTGIVGDNGAGKSSIIDGIVYAFTGSERGDKAGSSMNTAALSGGEKLMEVSLTLLLGDKEVVIVRGRKNKAPFAEITMDGKQVTSGETNVTTELENILKVDYDTLVNTSIFREEFQDQFLRANSSTREKFLRNYFCLDFIDDAYKKVNEDFKECRDFVRESETALNTYKQELANYDLLSLRKELENIDKELIEITGIYNTVNDKVVVAHKDRDKVQELPELECKAVSIKNELSELRVLFKESESKKDLSEKVTVLNDKIHNINVKHNELEHKAVTFSNLCKEQEKILELLEKTDDKARCYVCSQELVGNYKSELIETIKIIISKHDAIISEIDTEQGIILDDLSKLELELSDYNKQQIEYLEAQSFIKNKKDYIDKLAKDLEEVSIKLVELKNMKAGLLDISGLEEELDIALNKRDNLIARKSAIDTNIAECTRLIKETASIKLKLKSLDVDFKALEIAKTVFDKQGVVTSLLNYINDIIKKWSNHIVTLLSDDSIVIEIDKNAKGISIDIDWNGSKKDYIMYSGGEKTIINFAIRLGFSMALSEMTGFSLSLLILDEVLGKLDDNNRNQMVKIVNYVNDKGFKQILLITHTELKTYLSKVISIVKKDGFSITGDLV